MHPSIGHRVCLGTPLRLVVTATWSDRVDVAPVRLRLGMHQRVSIDLGRGSQEKRGVFRPRKAEHVHRPDGADLEGVNRIGVVLRRRRRRREMQDVAHVAADEYAVVDVGLAKLELRVALQGLEVVGRAGDEVVEGEDAHVPFEQRRAQVGTDESGSARDNRPRPGRATRGQCRDR